MYETQTLVAGTIILGVGNGGPQEAALEWIWHCVGDNLSFASSVCACASSLLGRHKST